MRDGDRDDRGDLVRDALRRAGDVAEPRLDRLRSAMPGLLDQVARRRAARFGEAPDPLLDQMLPLAWRALPGFAAATLVLVALSSAVLLANGDTTGDADGTIDLDRILLTGQSVGDASDPFVESWLHEEVNGDG